ncbi:unnamed protein product [Symbiodinium sp. CCMP2592]|nr:unnamed protein product [Symbiodinium sp. CCMP2592]
MLQQVAQSRYLHQLVREGILPDGEWKNCWETVGLGVNDCLVKSERASQSDNKLLTGLQMPGLCRTEWQIIPDALLVLLVQWSLAAGKRKQQSASKVFLCSFISAVASGSWLKQLLTRAPTAQAWSLCPQGSESKQCPHLEQGFRAHLQGDDTTLQTAFVECLLSLWAWVDECPSCKAIFQQLISEVTEHLQSRVSTVAHQDALAARHFDPCAQKRQHVDEDAVRQSKRQAVESNVSRARMNTCLGLANPEAAAAWTNRDACLYLAASWRAFEQVKKGDAVVGMCLDAKRLGNPAEDLLAGVVQIGSVAAWIPPQVLPDTASVVPKHSGKQSDLNAALQAFVEREAARASQDEEAEQALRPKRAANMHFLLAMDHGLEASTGHTLKDFLPLRRPERLKEHEERQLVKMPTPDGETSKRVVIRNKTTGKRVLECPKDLNSEGLAMSRPSLVCTIDQGSVGWPALQMLFQSCGIAGFYAHDPWHRVWNDLKAGCVAAGFWSIVRQCTLVMNVRSGPFEGAAFHGQLKESLAHMRSLDMSNNIWFLSCYESICKEWGLQADIAFGDSEHMLHVLEMVLASKALQSKGSTVKWARWASFFDCGQDFRHSWAAHLCIMLHHGWLAGWWDSLSDAPLGGSSHDDFGVQGVVALSKAAGSSSGSSSRSVKHSNDQIRLLRGQCRNGLELSTLIMANDATRRMFNMLLEICDPIRARMGKDMKTMEKGPTEQLQVLLQWSTGTKYNICFRDVFVKLSDVDALDWMGFEQHCVDEDETADESLVLEQDEMASRALLLAREVVAARAFSMMEYTDALPMLRVSLLQDSGDAVSVALTRLKQVWEALLDAEDRCREDTFFRSFLDSLAWPNLVTVRSVMTTLVENDWALSAQLKQQLTKLFSAMAHTKLVEEAFNKLTDMERHTKSGSTGKVAMWQELAECKLLTSQGYSHPEVPPGLQAPKSLPPKVFSPPQMEAFSLGKDALLELQCEDTWVSLSPQGHSLIGLASKALVLCVGQPQKLKTCFLSLLAQPGTVIWHADQPERVIWVLKATAWGVLGWPIQTCKFKGPSRKMLHFVTLSIEDKAAVQTVLIHSLNNWRVGVVSVRSPLNLSQRKVKDQKLKGIVLEFPETMPATLLEHAASCGFRGVTLVYLQKLFTSLKVAYTGAKPTTVKGVSLALMKHIFPAGSDDDFAKMLARRDASEMTELPCLIRDEHNLNLAEDFLEPEEVQQCRKQLQKRAVQKPAHAEGGSAAPPASHCAAGSPSEAGAAAASTNSGSVKEPLKINWAKIQLAEVRIHVPKAPGVRINQELKLANRWKAHYPREKYPRWFSLVYSDAASEKQSVRACLQFLWQVHEEETGQKCPFDLEAVV